jgi:hypothetical protein
MIKYEIVLITDEIKKEAIKNPNIFIVLGFTIFDL